MLRKIIPLLAAAALGEAFNAGVRCYDLSEPTRPQDVAYFIPPNGGTLSPECRETTTGVYVLTCPALGKPIYDPMPVKQWGHPGVNVGLTSAT